MNKTDIAAAATLILSPKPVHVRKKTTIKNLFRPITAFRIFALFRRKFMSWVEEYE